MRLEPLYRCTVAPTESWHVTLDGAGGTEEQGFLLVEGRVRAANYSPRRAEGTLTPDFRGAIETDDGAVVVFSWHGYGRAADGASRMLGSITHLSDDARYQWLNNALCDLAGEMRPLDGGRFDVVLDVFELIWEPLQEHGR